MCGTIFWSDFRRYGHFWDDMLNLKRRMRECVKAVADDLFCLRSV